MEAHSLYVCSSAADAGAGRGGRRVLFDYEAFQVDSHGSLIFTRTLGPQRIKNFCLDMVSLTTTSNQKFSVMAAVFCQPSDTDDTEINESLQTLVLYTSSTSPRLVGVPGLILMMFLFYVPSK